jgi:hypothetical protein|tara:strand:- start:725 stop:898 length:174 start_codon:yes stop_codon:yes gene_type:complete
MSKKILTNIETGQKVEFKGYAVGETPKSFDKHRHMHFNKNGLTYIEKIESFWDIYNE